MDSHPRQRSESFCTRPTIQSTNSPTQAACLSPFNLSVSVVQGKFGRWWLYEQSLDGTLFVRRCLDKAEPYEVFGDLVNEWDGSHGWITVFFEEKKAGEELQPITDRTIIVFCKLYEPDFNTAKYIGHLLTDKAMPCSELLTSITQMANLSKEMSYSVFKEERCFGIREIVESQSSLAEV